MSDALVQAGKVAEAFNAWVNRRLSVGRKTGSRIVMPYLVQSTPAEQRELDDLKGETAGTGKQDPVAAIRMAEIHARIYARAGISPEQQVLLSGAFNKDPVALKSEPLFSVAAQVEAAATQVEAVTKPTAQASGSVFARVVRAAPVRAAAN